MATETALATSSKPISERERRFAMAYFTLSMDLGRDLGIGAQAYRRAFPSVDCTPQKAATFAFRLLESPNVRCMLEDMRKSLAQRAVMPVERIMQEVENVASFNPLDVIRLDEKGQPFVDLKGIEPHQAAAIKDIKVRELHKPDGSVHRTVEVSFYNKLQALEMLCKIHGLFKDDKFDLEDLDRAISVIERRLGRSQQLVTLDATATVVSDNRAEA